MEILGWQIKSQTVRHSVKIFFNFRTLILVVNSAFSTTSFWVWPPGSAGSTGRLSQLEIVSASKNYLSSVSAFNVNILAFLSISHNCEQIKKDISENCQQISEVLTQMFIYWQAWVRTLNLYKVSLPVPLRCGLSQFGLSHSGSGIQLEYNFATKSQTAFSG